MRAIFVSGIIAASIVTGGCASGRIGEAIELTTAGSQASGKLLESAQNVQNAFASSVRNDHFLRALQSTSGFPRTGCSLIGAASTVAEPPSQPSAAAKEALESTETKLRARTQLAAALGKTYSAMNALASYDAGGAVQSGLSDVFAATNTFRENVGLSPVSPTIGAVVPAVGGLLIQGKQLRALKGASRQLRTALGYYREALVRGQRGSVSVIQDEIGESYALRIALWRRGYLDANGLLTDIGASSGLTVPDASDVRLTASDEALCQGVRAALENKRDGLRSAAAEEYKIQIDVVDELIVAHEKFERGAPIDAAHLAAILDQLTALAKKIGDENGK